MGLYQVPYSAMSQAFNIRTVTADNADKLATLLNAELAAALSGSETDVVDFKLSGTGAGPNWEALFVTSSEPSEESNSAPLAGSHLTFCAASGGSPAEAQTKLFAAINALAIPAITVYKVEVAGGGIGTIFMAAALVLTNAS